MKRESNLKTHTNHCVVSALLFTREQSGQAISETISLTVSLTAGALREQTSWRRATAVVTYQYEHEYVRVHAPSTSTSTYARSKYEYAQSKQTRQP